MNIVGYLWREDVVDKLSWKHQIVIEEVIETFNSNPRIERVAKGHRPGENLYIALGQTDEGRYLIVFFIYKKTKEALIVTARNMTKKERKHYGRI